MAKRKYAIIDVETTGTLFNRDKITEIAIIVTDGKIILDQFQSLVHPERSIPPTITRITGIDDNLVKEAPKFYEIAKKIIELTDKCIFVAHNARFDYSFIKEEFRNLGYAYNKKTLCTVKLSRAIVPGLPSYGLDHLIQHFNIHVQNRHRAYGDTKATFEIFTKLIEPLTDDFSIKTIINKGLNATVLPRGLSMDQLHEAPESPGVYYLSNQQDRVVYIGKAKDIKKRLFQHFRQLSRKSINIYNTIHKLHYEETGNELIALLWELHEIKAFQPELNKALRRNNYPYALYHRNHRAEDKAPLAILKHNNKNDFKHEKIKLFGSKLSADSFIQHVLLDHELCKKCVHSQSREFACFCENQCELFTSSIAHSREELIRLSKNEFEDDFIVILNGRHSRENAFVLVENGQFLGFGFREGPIGPKDLNVLKSNFHFAFSYPEANGILKLFLSKNEVEIIYL